MKVSDLITIDAEILSGTPVFKGTRVPIQSLFWHLEAGISIDEFLEDFPSVSKEQVVELLELSNKMMTTPKIVKLYENFAWRKFAEETQTGFPRTRNLYVADKNWNGKKNGELLALMLAEDFQALFTFDQNLEHQQNFTKYPIAVFVFIAQNNTYKILSELVPNIRAELAKSLPKGVTKIQK